MRKLAVVSVVSVGLAALIAGTLFMRRATAEGPHGRYTSRDVPISFVFRRGDVDMVGEFGTQSLPWRMFEVDSLQAEFEEQRLARIATLKHETRNLENNRKHLEEWKAKGEKGLEGLERAVVSMEADEEEIAALERLDWKGYAHRYSVTKPEKLVRISESKKQPFQRGGFFLIHENERLVSVGTGEVYKRAAK
jgi:hypothetical protein